MIDSHTSVLAEACADPHQFQYLILDADHKIRFNAVVSVCRAKWMKAISALSIRSQSFFLAGEESESGYAIVLSPLRRSGRMVRQIRNSSKSTNTDLLEDHLASDVSTRTTASTTQGTVDGDQRHSINRGVRFDRSRVF